MFFRLEPKENREELYDFDNELNMLVKAIGDRSVKMIVITGLRRMGKTSLLKVGLREAKTPYLYLDARKYEYLSIEKFYGLLSSSLEDFLRDIKGLSGKLVKFLSRIKGVSVKGLSVELKAREASLADVLEKIDEWSEAQGLRTVIAIDEAQELKGFRIDRALAYGYDNLANLCFVITGSEVGVLKEFLGVENPNAPLFGRALLEIGLGRLSGEDAVGFLRKGFTEVGLSVDARVLEEAVRVLDGIIGWLTHFGWYTWKLKSPKAGLEKTLGESEALIKRELGRFLEGRSMAKDRYLLILEALSLRSMRWSELKRYVEFEVGVRLANKQFAKYLHELNRYGFLEKRDNEYRLGDPLVGGAAGSLRRH